MVYKLGQEERAQVPPRRTHGPLPAESSFVHAARDSIPQARVRITTASSRGNLRGRGRGRKSNAHAPDDAQEASRGRGRATRKRRSDASTSNTANRGRGRARTHATNNTDIVTAEYWLLGDVEQQRSAIPDLNASRVPDLNALHHHGEGEKIPLTQNAPDPDVV